MQTQEATFLPRPLRVEAVTAADDAVVVCACLAEDGAECPDCGQAATRVQNKYVRTLDDVPWAGRRARLRVTIRRFRCAAVRCPRRIFAERLGGFARPSARRTARADIALEAVAFALGGEAGGAPRRGPRPADEPGHPAAPDPPRARAGRPPGPGLRRG